MSQTVKDVADLLALNQPYESGYYARQIRTHVQEGRILPDAKSGHGRTSAALFSEHHAFEAQILSVLTEIGLTRDLLNMAAKEMRGTTYHRFPDALPPTRQTGTSHGFVRDAIEGVRANEDWRFEFRIIRKSNGERFVLCVPLFSDERGGDAPEPGTGFLVASVVLNLNVIFAPLLA